MDDTERLALQNFTIRTSSVGTGYIVCRTCDRLVKGMAGPRWYFDELSLHSLVMRLVAHAKHVHPFLLDPKEDVKALKEDVKAQIKPLLDAVMMAVDSMAPRISLALAAQDKCIVDINDLVMVLNGGAKNQNELDGAKRNLRACLPPSVSRRNVPSQATHSLIRDANEE